MSAPRRHPGSGQYPLPLAGSPRLGRDDLMVGAANQAALAWCDRWPDWPHPVATLVGPAGSGKSHLLAIWQAHSAARELAITDLTPDALGHLMIEQTGGAGIWALDDAERLAGNPLAEQALFHLINLLREQGGSLLMTAQAEPARWGVHLPDLSSRLKACPVLTLAAPDDAMLAAILLKQFADRQLQIGTEVLDYLLPRIERSYAAAGEIVAALDAEALATSRRITIPLVRQMLESGAWARQGDLEI